MPVRRTIASESRRIPGLRSPLLTARAGRYEPVPTILLCHTLGLHEPHDASLLVIRPRRSSCVARVSCVQRPLRDRRDGARDAIDAPYASPGTIHVYPRGLAGIIGCPGTGVNLAWLHFKTGFATLNEICLPQGTVCPERMHEENPCDSDASAIARSDHPSHRVFERPEEDVGRFAGLRKTAEGLSGQPV